MTASFRSRFLVAVCAVVLAVSVSAAAWTPVSIDDEAKAYIIQTDPFFAKLKAWGDTAWKLWDHNKQLPGAAPVLMTSTVVKP